MDKYPELYRLVATRYSCRNYLPRAVGRDALEAVFDVARLAPSACNRQPWLFIIASAPDEREAILKAYPRDWMATAPEFIVACGVTSEGWHRPTDGVDHTPIDVAIAVEHICLGATAMGLATCWVCNFDPTVITSAFNLPEGIVPVAILPIGYPVPMPEVPVKQRKPLEAIVREGKF